MDLADITDALPTFIITLLLIWRIDRVERRLKRRLETVLGVRHDPQDDDL